MKQKRIYDRDFKETAVKLSQHRADIGALAIELGITKKLDIQTSPGQKVKPLSLVFVYNIF